MQRTIFYLLMLCLLFSCKKRETPHPTIPEGNDKTSKLDAYGKALVKVEAAVNELDYIGLKVLSNLNGYPNGSQCLACADVTTGITPEGHRTITLSFNPSKTCTDKYIRQGQLVLDYNETNGALKIQLVNYMVNGVKVEGNYNFGYSNARKVRNLVITNGALKKEGAWFINFSAYRDIVWKAGEQTPDNDMDNILEVQDAYYNLGIQDLGLISADVNATNPLVLKWSCYGETQYLPVSGITLNKTPQGAFSRTNYGNGHCNSYPISEY